MGGVWCHRLLPPLLIHPSPDKSSVSCGNHFWLPMNTSGSERKCLFSSFFSSEWPLLSVAPFLGCHRPFWSCSLTGGAAWGLLTSIRYPDAWQPQVCEGSPGLKGNHSRHKHKSPPLVMTDFQYCIVYLQ